MGVSNNLGGFATMPQNGYQEGAASIISQNLGAGQTDRVRKGARFGVIAAAVIAEIIGIFTFIFIPQLVSLFDSTSEKVIWYGTIKGHTCALFYCLLAFSHAMAAIMRGAGKAVVPMIVMLVCWCVIRVSILYVTGLYAHDINYVNMVYPITWALSSLIFGIYYSRFDFGKAVRL
jgi:Na+-driven multidrug efflux pump